METPIQQMYKAAKVTIPEHGGRVSSVANTLIGALDALNAPTAHAGDPAALVSMLHVGGDIHSVLLKAVTSLDNVSVALKATADHYVATDDQARADYDNLDKSLKNDPMPPEHNPQHGTSGDLDAPGYDVPPSPYYPIPGQGGGHVDGSVDPGSPEAEQQDRENNEPEAPDAPPVGGS